MRIMGFSNMWAKLNKGKYTTYRYPRKDRDWGIGELVQIVYRPRTKGRMLLGIAKIIDKSEKRLENITLQEANEDGFLTIEAMIKYIRQPNRTNVVKKLRLEWLKVLGDWWV